MTIDTAIDVSATRQQLADYPELYLAIAGEQRRGHDRQTRTVVNPVTGHVLGQVPLATDQDLADALIATEAAFTVWSGRTAYERAAVLHKAAAWMRENVDVGARLISLELGKVLQEARTEVQTAASLFEWTADEALRAYGRIIPGRRAGLHLEAQVRPVGPVYAVSSWNAPINTPARKVSGALAAGCSIILKLSDQVPASGLFLYDALIAAGLPAGVLQVVTGRGAQVSDAIIPSPIIRLVTLTGSVELGRQLASQAAHHLKPQTMELGGHAPAIIDRGIDVERVARAAARSKFRNVGQVCTAPTRFYVHQDIVADFTEHFVAEAALLKVGDPFEAGSEVGPVQNERHLNEIEMLVKDAVAHGATLAGGGTRLGSEGNFFAPAVLTDVPAAADVTETEPFGPIALIYPYADIKDAIAAANSLSVGLSAYGFTDSGSLAHRLATELKAGNIILNNWNSSFPETPFGGVGDSGFGREGGPEGLGEFLMTVFVSNEYRQPETP
jgi:succinate-semialdehyde dehydrogenase/glutarate-semialdehyde dehydrogenase